jgi:lysozyme
VERGISNLAFGPDVSHWSPVKDWSQLVGSGASIFGAKVSDGGTYVDSSFTTHRDGFRAQSTLKLAVYYHFGRIVSPSSAAAQADHLVDVVGELQPNERLCLDLEAGSWGPLLPTDIRRQGLKWIDDFFSRLLDGVCKSVRPLIYTSDRIWHAMGNPAWTLASEVDLWAPRYSPAMDEPALPYPWSAWTLWQWSDGKTPANDVPGIGTCDTNVFRGDVAALEQYLAPKVAAG